MKKKKIINFAIIPARIGSERIKKKNIKIFNGKPMLEWAFQIVSKSKLFDKIIISSESTEVLKIAKKIGFNLLIKRPKNLANNFIGTSDVIKHAIKELERNYYFDNVCCVYPCNPFIQISDIKKTFKILKKNKGKLIFPVTNYSHPIERAYSFKNKNDLRFLKTSFMQSRTQDLKTKYYDTGQFYFASKKSWLKTNLNNKIGLKIPNWRVIDIDNKVDWKRAEILFKLLKNSNLLKSS